MEKFELHPLLEAEIKSLTEQAEAKSREMGLEKKEAFEVSLREKTEKLAEKIISPETSKILPDYALSAPNETKLFVEKVIDELWHDGNLVKAVSAARRGGSLAFDMFHDIVSGKMTEILKARGIL